MPFPLPSEETPQLQNPATSLSKRAALRIIQRTLVLMEKNKSLRQIIRTAKISTVWVIEGWGLEWTVFLDRGKFDFERRLSKHPDMTIAWPTAELFFAQADHARDAELSAHVTPTQTNSHLIAPLLRGFFLTLRQVLEDPVDAVGKSLL